jgi:multiple sugar transport system permease protein
MADTLEPTRTARLDANPPHAPVESGLVTGSSRVGNILRGVLLTAGALLFLFPFYYMVIGSLQGNPDTSIGGLIPHKALTLHNFSQINGRVDLVRSLVNSGIFTAGVILCTVVFGLLAGYALARLHFRGRGTVFAAMLLVQVVPFQLLLIPLYVLIVRTYGLGDNYLGIILPYAINTAAVFIFRQFFLQLPNELFEAARIDGASELRILRSIALPLVKPAVLTTILLTFIGPWNEFLWPFLVTKDASMQPLAVSLANYISNVASRASNPYGAVLAGAVVLAAPAVALFVMFQRHFNNTDLGSGVKG